MASRKFLSLVGLLAFPAGSVSMAQVSAGTLSGTVRDARGAPFRGAFVRIQNKATKITLNVLSDEKGHYRAQSLTPGEYQAGATAIGYKGNPRIDVKIAAGEHASRDFALDQGVVLWSDLSMYQGKKLLPEGKGKDIMERQCLECHNFQTRMAAKPRDEAGWVAAVKYMRESMAYRLDRFTDQDASEVVSYLVKYFGPHSELPKSPADLPGYKETVRQFSNEAMKIEYVDYELPGPNRHPFSATPDKDGNMWIPYFGRANQIAKLYPYTGEVQEFRVPNQGTAAIHSAVPAPDGTVWLGEQGSNKVGKWDPATRMITEYQDSMPAGGMNKLGSKHTIRIDPQGNIWATGFPLSRLDPKTGKFTDFGDASPIAYGIAPDKEGNIWFTEFFEKGKLGKIDAKTGEVTKWDPPTPKSWPRRIQIDADGMVWFAEYNTGKIARFDPKTQTFKEWPLPGQSPTPYAFAMDGRGLWWYSSFDMDTIGCLNPETGRVIEYPMPYSENTMREFFLDSKGRMWYGTPSNNKVGYFVLSTGS